MLGISLLLGLGLLSCRRYNGTMPLVSTNSRAISASCHVLKEDISDGYLMPLQWAVVEVRAGEYAHCTFTTAYNVKAPDAAHRYI